MKKAERGASRAESFVRARMLTSDKRDNAEAQRFDSIATAIKKMAARGKERGYLTYDELNAAKQAILEFGQRVVRLGGCPLAEHGVGRNPIKQQLLRAMYGEQGIDEMRAVKRALDPEWKLAPGVIFPPA